MTAEKFWYCVRLELEFDQGKPHYGRFFREALKTFFPSRFSRRQHPLPEKEILFVIITENHLKHFQPVAKALARSNHSFSILFTNEVLFEKHADEWPGLSYSIHSFVTQKQYFNAVLFQTRLLWTNMFSPSRTQATIIRLAKPTYLIHKTMLGLLQGVSSKVVLFKSEGYQANAVLAACRQFKIPSFAIQHGLIGDTNQVSNLAVDTYLVWAELFKTRLEHWQAGCRIQITGNAAYDLVFQNAEKAQLQPLADFPFHLLVLPNAGVSHTPLSQVFGLLDAVLHFAKQNTGVCISIKPHPADSQENVAKYLTPHLTRHSNIRLLDRYESIPFEKAHLVAINNSGAGMEACIWQKPLLVFASAWEEVMVKQYVEHGVAEFANTPESFAEKVLEIQSHYADYQQRCSEFTRTQLAFPGQAANKIVEALTC